VDEPCGRQLDRFDLRWFLTSGIILLDPPVKINPSSTLYWQNNASPEFGLRPSFSSFTSESSNRPASLFDGLLNYYTNMSPRAAAIATNDFFYATSHIYRIIASEWLNLSHIIDCELMRLDYGQEHDHEDVFQSLQHKLFVLHVWRRRCSKYTEFLADTMSVCNDRGPLCRSKTEASHEKAAERAGDFRSLLQTFEQMKDLTEKQVTTVLGRISIEIGKRSVAEAHRVTRLTIVALVFLPLQFVEGLLGMNGPFALGAPLGWMFWVVAIPLTFAVTYAGLYRKSRQPTIMNSPDAVTSDLLLKLGMGY
jgi:CorA-like Mg2+ transporter protein